MRKTLMMVLLGILTFSAGAYAEEMDPVAAFRAEVRAYHDQTREETTAHNTQYKELQGKIQALKADFAKADVSARNQIKTEINSLGAEMLDLREAMAKKEIEHLEKEVEFNNRQLDFARERLEKIQASRNERRS